MAINQSAVRQSVDAYPRPDSVSHRLTDGPFRYQKPWPLGIDHKGDGVIAMPFADRDDAVRWLEQMKRTLAPEGGWGPMTSITYCGRLVSPDGEAPCGIWLAQIAGQDLGGYLDVEEVSNPLPNAEPVFIGAVADGTAGAAELS